MDNWLIFNNGIYNCSRLICVVSDSSNYKYTAALFSRFYFNLNVESNRTTKNYLVNLEALSRWKEMNMISQGNSNKFDVLISYKLYYSKNHIAYPYYIDIDDIINAAKKSLKSVENFMSRKNIVFIYGQYYRNRNKLCDLFEKKIKADKYGSAFKEKLKWPNNIPDIK